MYFSTVGNQNDVCVDNLLQHTMIVVLVLQRTTVTVQKWCIPVTYILLSSALFVK